MNSKNISRLKQTLNRWRARKELAKCQRRWTGPDETSSTGFSSSVILLGVVVSTACARAMLLDLHRDLVMGLPSVIAGVHRRQHHSVGHSKSI
jgi:hypothetical protein